MMQPNPVQQPHQDVQDQTTAQEQLQEASTEQGENQESTQDESLRPHCKLIHKFEKKKSYDIFHKLHMLKQ